MMKILAEVRHDNTSGETELVPESLACVTGI